MTAYGWMPAKRLLRPISASSGLIKGQVALEEGPDLFPGFSASGQDVWLPASAARATGPGIVLSAVGARCGKAFLADFERWGAVANTASFGVASGFDKNFVHYILNHEDFWIRGGAAQPYVMVSESLKQQVWAPELAHQRAIADFLDRETAQIDAFIAKNEELIALLTERRAVAVNHLVWAGVSSDAIPSAAGDRLPDAPAHWLRVRNKQLYRERTGVSLSGAEELLTVSHITGVTTRAEKNVTMFEAESTVGYKLVSPGDLVINTMWAWMGALGVSALDGIASPSYGVYSPLRNLPYEPRYFDHLYRSAPYVATMTVHSRGVTESRLRLYPDAFLSLPTVVPPLEEQREIVDRITTQTTHLDAMTSAARRAIDLARERRAALISAAVTGKIDMGVSA
ncbi:restriction endonuclease subunit S [Tessaracoccus sp. MC1679]|uniref:restriction endonuclease subunit S n=1 Tax=Tessaracoccus sp. MC1679 TaxID=2760313 RepID=UPI001601331F|nr:restriction endonuclease subunit S [Tessaracoccus sp. MC1679]MBB1516740.1 restriction endonuclease subunit S [Tessaracoccus sp. MC1679]